jgi:hypothetical protein
MAIELWDRMPSADRILLASHFDVGAVDVDTPHPASDLPAGNLDVQMHAQDNGILVGTHEMKLYARFQLLLAVHDDLHATRSSNPMASHRDIAGDLHYRRLVCQRVYASSRGAKSGAGLFTGRAPSKDESPLPPEGICEWIAAPA